MNADYVFTQHDFEAGIDGFSIKKALVSVFKQIIYKTKKTIQ